MENTIITALAAIPALIKKIEALITSITNRDTTYAKLLQERVDARVPNDELKKICDVVASTVSQTKCAAPDVESSTAQISQGVLFMTRGLLKEFIGETIEEELGEKKKELMKIAKRRFLFLGVFTLCICVAYAITLFSHYHSEAYWGEQYMSIITSKYVMNSERDALWNDCYSTGVLPKGFNSNEDFYKNRIKQNKLVINERKRQAKSNNGKFKATPPIER